MVNIPYYIVYKKYRTSWIRATDKFIDGKILQDFRLGGGKAQQLLAIHSTRIKEFGGRLRRPIKIGRGFWREEAQFGGEV